MTLESLYAIGGIGMFLLGMGILTGALRDAAGSNLRALLARFTTTPLRGVLTGAAGTAVIQSSSATTVLTVGFVGAGLLSMTEALGIIYGANIGTTATGWLVSLIGFKLNLHLAAMGLLLPASLLDLLGRGVWVRVGRGVAGMCLLIIGLELMQTGLAGLSDIITPDTLPGRSLWGLLLLAGIGLVITVVMQSSSAAIALALVMLESGAIDLIQAAGLVVGMNIGTTFTAILASVGGSRAMRQTAIGNLIFNCAIALLAFPILVVSAPLLRDVAANYDAMTALLVFHTGFNVLGAALFLPITRQFAAFVSRVVPDTEQGWQVALDRSLLKDSDAALVAAQGAADRIARRLFEAFGNLLQPQPDYRGVSALDSCREALDRLKEFLSHVHPDRANAEEEHTYSALLHQADHMQRMLERSRRTTHVLGLLDNRMSRRPALLVGATLRRMANTENGEGRRLQRLHLLVKHRKDKHRRGLMLAEHAGIYQLKDVFAHTDAMRWLDRSLHHAERVAHYQELAGRRFPSTPGEVEGEKS